MDYKFVIRFSSLYDILIRSGVTFQANIPDLSMKLYKSDVVVR